MKDLNSYKYLFVLTTNGSDEYIHMTEIAIESIVQSHQEPEIEVLLDPESFRNIKAKSSALYHMNVKFVVKSSQFSHPAMINRDLKTRARQIISGNFVYLDGDVVVRQPLTDAWSEHFDIAGVRTMNSISPEYSDFAKKTFKRWNKPLPPKGQVNGGVLFFRETTDSLNFSQMYRENWLAFKNEVGRFNDEPALSLSVSETSAKFIFLDHRYNAQEVFRPSALPEAKIWHFFFSAVSSGSVGNRWEEHLVRRMSKDPLPEVNWASMRHPYFQNGFVRRLAILYALHTRRIIKRKSLVRLIMRYGFPRASRIWIRGYAMEFLRGLRGEQ